MERIVLLIILLVLTSCARAPIKDAHQAMRVTAAPELDDDLDVSGLLAAIDQEVAVLETSDSQRIFQFGPLSYTKEEYIHGLKRFLELGKLPRKEFFDAIKKEFQFFEVYGDTKWGDVFITSYYEPVLSGSSRKTERFSQPIYRTPENIYRLDLAKFDQKYSQDRKMRARIEGQNLLPFYSREEIDSKGALLGKGLEICYLDPIDAFVLQIQGSGRIVLEDKVAELRTVRDLLAQQPSEIKSDIDQPHEILRVGYAEKNGFPYEPVGKFLKNVIPPEQMSLHTIEAYLRTLPVDKAQEYMNKNPSYVFFSVLENPAITSLGVSATDGRTIATDGRFFSKGSIAFLVAEKPEFESPSSTVPKEWKKFSRFVLDQDIGGAITGPGRLDLFWGSGPSAKQVAGVMKQRGRLFYLAPKK